MCVLRRTAPPNLLRDMTKQSWNRDWILRGIKKPFWTACSYPQPKWRVLFISKMFGEMFGIVCQHVNIERFHHLSWTLGFVSFPALMKASTFSAKSGRRGGVVQPLQRRLPPLWLLHNFLHSSCPRELTFWYWSILLTLLPGRERQIDTHCVNTIISSANLNDMHLLLNMCKKGTKPMGDIMF